MAGHAAVAAAVADAHRREWALVLAATVRVTRDLDVAEECAQDAFAAALTDWSRSGIPARPGAWLTTTAKRRALNVLRHRIVENRALPLLVEDATVPGPAELVDERADGAPLPDDRLRLIATCCHPALDRTAQVALTLRLVCGLSTAEVARAFLVGEATMAARITRAKKKIAVARIPYRVPPAAELPERIDAVLAVVHLLFTTGHTPPAGEELVRRDLVQRSLDLCRLLRRLLPDDPAVAGLLALLLLTEARRETRTGPDGRLLLLAEQDRGRWDHRAIREGAALVREALRGRPPHRYALQAAIAAVHAEAPRSGLPPRPRPPPPPPRRPGGATPTARSPSRCAASGGGSGRRGWSRSPGRPRSGSRGAPRRGSPPWTGGPASASWPGTAPPPP